MCDEVAGTGSRAGPSSTNIVASQNLYGLRVRSSSPLPFPLAQCDGVADLTIHDAGYPARPEIMRKNGGSPMLWSREADGYSLSYSFLSGEQLQFRFNRGGDNLVVRHNLKDRRDAALLLLGMGFAAALHLRRTPLLHAASVQTENGAIALVGKSGAGKSTLAGALVQAGCPFVCDDLAALQTDASGVRIEPGHPLLKIHRRAADSLGIPAELHQPVFHSFPGYEERWVDTGELSGGTAVSRLPLRSIYILSGRRPGLERPLITPLEPSMGCLELTRQLYGREWLNISPKEAFEVSARIAGHLSFRRVLLPEGIDSSTANAAGIMADAAMLSR